MTEMAVPVFRVDVQQIGRLVSVSEVDDEACGTEEEETELRSQTQTYPNAKRGLRCDLQSLEHVITEHLESPLSFPCLSTHGFKEMAGVLLPRKQNIKMTGGMQAGNATPDVMRRFPLRRPVLEAPAPASIAIGKSWQCPSKRPPSGWTRDTLSPRKVVAPMQTRDALEQVRKRHEERTSQPAECNFEIEKPVASPKLLRGHLAKLEPAGDSRRDDHDRSGTDENANMGTTPELAVTERGPGAEAWLAQKKAAALKKLAIENSPLFPWHGRRPALAVSQQGSAQKRVAGDEQHSEAQTSHVLSSTPRTARVHGTASQSAAHTAHRRPSTAPQHPSTPRARARARATPRQHARSFAQSEQCLAFRPAGRVPLDLLESYCAGVDACGGGGGAGAGPPPRTPRLSRAASKKESSTAPGPSAAHVIWPQGKPSFSCKFGLRGNFHASIFFDPASAVADPADPAVDSAAAAVGGQGGEKGGEKGGARAQEGAAAAGAADQLGSAQVSKRTLYHP